MRAAISALMLTFVTAVGLAFFVAPQLAKLTERIKTVFPNQPLLLRETWVNDTHLAITIQNIATVEVNITQITINNRSYSQIPIQTLPQQVRTIYLRGDYKRGETYTVTLTTSFGKPLTVSIKYD